MAQNDLYLLLKSKYEAQLRLEKLQHQQRLNASNALSSKMQTMLSAHHENVAQMKGIIDEFNKKTGEIREKLAIRNCLDMDRECGKCVQTIFDKSCEVFNNNYKNYFVDEKNFPSVEEFAVTANERLREHEEFNQAATSLVSPLFEQNKANFANVEEKESSSEQGQPSSHQSDDTIITIASENVFSSSPYPRC